MGDYIHKRETISKDGEVIYQNSRQFYNPFKVGRGYNLKYKSNNIRKYLDIPLPRVFTAAEVGRLIWLVEKVDPDSNLLAKKLPGKDLEPISRADLQKIVELSSRTSFGAFFNKLQKHKLIKPTSTLPKKYYCLSPIYFNACRYLPLYVYITYEKELREHLPPWVIEEYLGWVKQNGVDLQKYKEANLDEKAKNDNDKKK